MNKKFLFIFLIFIYQNSFNVIETRNNKNNKNQHRPKINKNQNNILKFLLNKNGAFKLQGHKNVFSASYSSTVTYNNGKFTQEHLTIFLKKNKTNQNEIAISPTKRGFVIENTKKLSLFNYQKNSNINTNTQESLYINFDNIKK